MNPADEQKHIDALEAEVYPPQPPRRKRRTTPREMQPKAQGWWENYSKKGHPVYDPNTRESFDDWVKRVGGEAE